MHTMFHNINILHTFALFHTVRIVKSSHDRNNEIKKT